MCQRELILGEDDAQAVALVRAVEETDRGGMLLPLAERRAATAAARADHADGDAWLVARAGRLAAAMKRQLPFLPRFLRFTSPVRGLLAPALAVAFVLGIATNALGPRQRINVLAVPLLGLIAWNLAVLTLSAARAVLPLDLGSGAPRFVGRLEALARRLVSKVPLKGGKWSQPPPKADKLPTASRRGSREEQQACLRRALERYMRDWLPVVAPLASARGRRLLHASSLVLILGVVAGMYARGVAFQYHATWESTFLSAGAVDAFLGTVLAPASALLGSAVPSAVAIESPASGDAAPWIHLWAVTAALLVGTPRLVLAAASSLRCARRRRRLEISVADSYRRRLLASAGTSDRRLEVLPFSYRPPAGGAETLKRMLFDLFGPRSEIRLRPTLDYGVEPAELAPGDGRLQMVLFGLAQTPEVEVHGALLRRLRDDLPDGQALVAAVDASSYRRRLRGGGRVVERIAERRRAWDRIVRGAGLEAVHLDLAEGPDDQVLSRVLAVARPEGVLEA